ncbi:hypothetical protein P3342_009824 [Pyrenophora teres f. teres]|uniref:Uncharacterized protein n=2 Tax=Pyrenophora teres f. teres TaxID=97479 RepID=E3S358_PYRTT|nr:hypothetical protein PTT_16858 [Pyrenophora teres f. teres 0-1]KAK1912223.1 hypothetical protein P3342_009824 [Pyrenophora teres f. teres]
MSEDESGPSSQSDGELGMLNTKPSDEAASSSDPSSSNTEDSGDDKSTSKPRDTHMSSDEESDFNRYPATKASRKTTSTTIPAYSTTSIASPTEIATEENLAAMRLYAKLEEVDRETSLPGNPHKIGVGTRNGRVQITGKGSNRPTSCWATT